MNFEEKTIKKELVYQGKILDIEMHDVLLPNGNTSQREIIKHNGAVAILALTDKNEILLVEQYRKAAEITSLEIPAGKLDKNEDRLACAVRELREETGYKIDVSNLQKIYDTHLAIGYSSELISIYYVDNLSDSHLGRMSPDEDEFLNVKKFSLAQAYDMLDKQVITDAKTIIALCWLRNRKVVS